VAEVFKETYNRMLSGYLLRDVVDLVDNIHFQSKDEIFTLAHLYESMLKEMRDAAGDSGEFYTPRPGGQTDRGQGQAAAGRDAFLTRPAARAGFWSSRMSISSRWSGIPKSRNPAKRDLFGVEKKPLPYLLSTMNLLLHGHRNAQHPPR
jgi:type I restriction enzyme M protein